jgi:hypothetical protein
VGTPLQALPKGRSLVVVSTKLVEFASRKVDRTIMKWEFGTPLDGDQKRFKSTPEAKCNTRVTKLHHKFLPPVSARVWPGHTQCWSEHVLERLRRPCVWPPPCAWPSPQPVLSRWHPTRKCDFFRAPSPFHLLRKPFCARRKRPPALLSEIWLDLA